MPNLTTFSQMCSTAINFYRKINRNTLNLILKVLFSPKSISMWTIYNIQHTVVFSKKYFNVNNLQHTFIQVPQMWKWMIILSQYAFHYKSNQLTSQVKPDTNYIMLSFPFIKSNDAHCILANQRHQRPTCLKASYQWEPSISQQ